MAVIQRLLLVAPGTTLNRASPGRTENSIFLPIEASAGEADRGACKTRPAGSIALESNQIGFVFDLTDKQVSPCN